MPDEQAEALKSLELVNRFVASDASDALSCSLITSFIRHWIEQRRDEDLFKRSPLATLTYCALEARTQTALGNITTAFEDVAQLGRIREKWKCVLDCAPRWEQPELLRFMAAHRSWFDFRPALLWSFQSSINRLLKARGLKTSNDFLGISLEMVELVLLILQSSCRDSARASIPERQVLAEQLTEFKEKFIESVDLIETRSRTRSSIDPGSKGEITFC